MDNITFISITNPLTNTAEEHAIIAHADGSFTTMLKATYDAQQSLQENN